MKFNKNHPMISWLITQGGKPADFTWDQIAERFDINGTVKISRSQKASNKWQRFISTQSGLILKKEKRDKDGEVLSQVYGREENQPQVDMSNMRVIGGTTDSNGGPGWWRVISDEYNEVLERMQSEIEQANSQKSLSFPNKSQKFEKWVLIGCVHVPYQNPLLWKSLLHYLRDNKVDGIVLAGDFLDLKSISNYDKDNVFTLTLNEEYMKGYEAILELESVLPKHAKRVFIYGNHEDRYIREINKISAARYGEALVSPEKAMKLEELGWEVLTNWKDDFIVIGRNLEVMHGYRLGKGALRSSLADSMKNGRSVAFFHTHAFGSFTDGKYAAFNGGGLFDRANKEAFGYVGRNTRENWQNGFLEVILDKKGDHFVTPIKCTDTGFFANNKHY